MQLCQAEALRVLYDQGVRVRDVQTAFDDAGAYQNVGLSSDKVEHGMG